VVTSETHNRVREFRGRHELTLWQLAQLVGTTPQVLQHLETRGKRRPWSVDLERLADVLDTTVDELFPLEATTRPGTPTDSADNGKAD
jgi:transcriptional regulator with XRE-family HTH domain